VRIGARLGRQLALQTVLVAALALPCAGCALFKGAALLWGEEPTKKVPPEYPYLAGKKLCLLVWAEPYTLFEYRWVQLDLSEFVRTALDGTVHGVTFAPNRQVVEYQDRHSDWDREHPARIGTRFGADRVLLIELTQYTTREPDSPYLLRGHIGANVKVYDTAYPDAEPAYKTVVEAAYPPESVGEYGTDDRTIRAATMQAFAAKLAAKFYERQEKTK
jgi:hypothetical protein